MDARTEALEMAYEAGEVSTWDVVSQANHFDCDPVEVSDVFENRCQNIFALCVAADVTEAEMNNAYSNGQRRTGTY